MLSSKTRSVVTATVVLEVGIAGWALGHGALWLLEDSPTGGLYRLTPK